VEIYDGDLSGPEFPTLLKPRSRYGRSSGTGSESEGGSGRDGDRESDEPAVDAQSFRQRTIGSRTQSSAQNGKVIVTRKR